jgi:hypothetical protein
MNTTLKLILAAASITAWLVPASASNDSRSTSSMEVSRRAPVHAYGSVSRSRFNTNQGLPIVRDCVRVAFPQCSGGN